MHVVTALQAPLYVNWQYPIEPAQTVSDTELQVQIVNEFGALPPGYSH